MPPEQIDKLYLFLTVFCAIVSRSDYNQTEMAAWIGVRQSCFSRRLAGNTELSFAEMLIILDKLNVDIGDFYIRVQRFEEYIRQFENYTIYIGKNPPHHCGCLGLIEVKKLYDKYVTETIKSL